MSLVVLAASAALPPEAEPLRASLAPLLGAVPWREALMMASPVIGTMVLRRPRR